MTWQEQIQKLQVTPDKPGVYLLKDPIDSILYVGKASNLKTRLRHYFASPSKLEGKQKYLIKKISDFDYVVTSSETEALILENIYIKRYKPHYNIRLKDDKTYPYIKIDLNENFPRPQITRERLNDSAQYFGPYTNAKSIRQTLNLLNRLFPYRTCSKTITGTDPRACLEFYINRCAAPCTGEISSLQYREIINQLVKFLNGRTKDVTKSLKNSMNSASQSMQYEKAAKLRDQIESINHITEIQTIVSRNKENIDVLGLASNNNVAWIEVLHVRYGTVTGRDNFQMIKVNNEDTGSILESFVKQFYDKSPQIPHSILSQEPIPDSKAVASWLETIAKRKVKLTVPQRGKRLQLLRLANINADYGLKKLSFQSDASPNALMKAIQNISHVLGLQNLPRRIECFDVSNTQGTDSVGSMVVFINGKPQKSHYRKFTIKSVSQPNDYAMMKEMLQRRLNYLVKGSRESSFGEIPDLILIDGGKGHLSAGLEVLSDMKLNKIQLASIAKREEHLFTPNNPGPVSLPNESPAMHLIQRIRDEAHRFAITFHRLKRSKRSVHSALDSIPGIGHAKKKQLMKKFGSIQNIKESPIAVIATTPGVNHKLAKLIKQHLRISSRSANYTYRSK